MRAALAAADQSIVVASAGEVNGGRFDPIADMAAMAEEFGAWLHVDAAFGLIAAFDPALSGLLKGIDRADSIAADAHKWLNVPYDSGLALIRDRNIANRTFAMPGAPYLEDLAGPDPGFASLGPDSSRRARAFAVFAAIVAYGRAGISEMIGRQMRAAAALAAAVDRSPDFRVLVEPVLPIVSFRAEPRGVADADLNAFNEAVAEKVNAAGRVAIGTTTVSGSRAMRAALLNWGVTEGIADELFDELNAAVSDLLRRNPIDRR
jgi:glutamate/tyrosine decarboxylase-like PLP-dependent enzyme